MVSDNPKQPKRLAPAWKAIIEIGFIIFLFYSNLLMGEFTRANGQGKSLAFALKDIFSATNLAIAIISGLLGYLGFDYLRKRLWLSRRIFDHKLRQTRSITVPRVSGSQRLLSRSHSADRGPALRYGNPESTLDDVPRESIDQVTQNLRCNDRHGQPPAPKTTFEPTNPSDGKGNAEKQEWNSHYVSVRCEFPESTRIEGPHSIESGATPH
jgi:hypothetical protein